MMWTKGKVFEFECWLAVCNLFGHCGCGNLKLHKTIRKLAHFSTVRNLQIYQITRTIIQELESNENRFSEPGKSRMKNDRYRFLVKHIGNINSAPHFAE